MQAERSEAGADLAETLCDGAAEGRGDLQLLVGQHSLQGGVARLTVRSKLRVRLALMATARQRTRGGWGGGHTDSIKLWGAGIRREDER